MKRVAVFYLPLFFLISLSSLEFVLLLRHKSPYMSDSYLYQHIFYEMQGDSFDEAFLKIQNKLEINRLSDIEKKIFFDQDAYTYSLSRYVRRPLYPFSAYLIDQLIQNEYIAFMVPVFVSFIGCIVLIYLLFRFRFDRFWSTSGALLFLSFYPYLDWSTYFLTDTIGAFFWLLQLFILIKYLQKPQSFLLRTFLFLVILSLFVRELSVLMFLVVGLLIMGTKLFRNNQNVGSTLKKLFIPTVAIAVGFLILNKILKYPSLYDSWIYLQNNFVYSTRQYSFVETAGFLWEEQIKLHWGLVVELVHHRWWSIITFLGFVGAFYAFFIEKKPKLIDLIMIASSVVAYIGLIIIPFLTYRYFYPTIIGLIYFCLYIVQSFFYRQQRNDTFIIRNSKAI